MKIQMQFLQKNLEKKKSERMVSTIIKIYTSLSLSRARVVAIALCFRGGGRESVTRRKRRRRRKNRLFSNTESEVSPKSEEEETKEENLSLLSKERFDSILDAILERCVSGNNTNK